MTEYAPTSAEFGLVEGTRRLKGLLLPFGERGQNADGYFEFGPGVIERPERIPLHLNHGGPKFGEGIVTESERGIEAEFDIAEGVIGDRFLEEYKRGKKHNLSAEFAGGVEKASDKITAVKAALTGAAAVVLGGFASAAFFEVAEVTPDGDVQVLPEAVEEAITHLVDEDGNVDINANQTPSSVSVTVEDAVTVYEPRPAEANTPNTEQEFKMAEATIPGGSNLTADTHKQVSDIATLFSLMVASRNGDVDAQAKFQKMAAAGRAEFALTDIKYNGTGGVNNVQLPQFVGEVWQARRTGRVVIPAFDNQALTDLTVSGWKFATRPTVGAWAGNKTAIPSTGSSVTPVSGATQRWAGGNDIAREFYDFNKTEVIAAFLASLADSYADVSDAWFLAQLVAAVTPEEVDVPVGTPEGLGKIVQGALNVVTAGGRPSIALVAPDVFRSIAFTKKDDTLEYLSASLGSDLTEGNGPGFSIKPVTGLAAGNVLVADRNAATAFELPGSPIRVNALNIANGGVDEAMHGYTGFLLNDAAGISLITSETP